jgi:hypothetical protein
MTNSRGYYLNPVRIKEIMELSEDRRGKGLERDTRPTRRASINLRGCTTIR